MVSRSLWIGGSVLLPVLVAVLLVSPPQLSPDSKLALIARGLSSAIKGHDPKCLNFAVAYNSNLDLIADAVEVIEQLSQAHPSYSLDGSLREVGSPSECDSIRDFGSLVSCFRFFLAQGAAAERMTLTQSFFSEIVEAARASPSQKVFIGGNAALVGYNVALNKDCSAPILLGGPVGAGLAGLMPPRVRPAGGKLADSDEFHLILEYGKGTVFGGATAPRANRFILHHDVRNGELEGLEEFHKALVEFDPNVFVVSGLHLMDGLAADRRTRHLERLIKELDDLHSTSNVTVHLELASMTDSAFMVEIAEKVLPRVHSLGLNEVELEALVRALGWSQQPLSSGCGSSPMSPSTGGVADAMIFLLDRMTGSKFSRIHFHTLAFHLVCHSSDGRWSSSPAAVAAAGSLSVTQKACSASAQLLTQPGARLSTVVETHLPSSLCTSREDSEAAFESSLLSPVHSWRVGGVLRSRHVCAMAPLLACQHPEKTVGLGDSISATGLLVQQLKVSS